MDKHETNQRIQIVRKLANVRRWLDSQAFLNSLLLSDTHVSLGEIRAAIIDDQHRLPYLTLHSRQSLIFLIQPKLSSTNKLVYWMALNMGGVNIQVDNGTVSQEVLEFLITSLAVLNLLARDGTVSIYSDLIDPTIRLIYNTRLEPPHLSNPSKFLQLIQGIRQDIRGPLQEAQTLAATAFNNKQHLEEEWFEDFGDDNEQSV